MELVSAAAHHAGDVVLLVVVIGLPEEIPLAGGSDGRALGRSHERPEVGAIEPARGLRPCQRDQRGGQVDERDRFRDSPARGDARSADEERHPHDFLELRPAVKDTAVLEELLSVVRRHHDHGPAEEAARAHERPQPLELVVDLPHARIVEIDEVRGIARIEDDVSPPCCQQLGGAAVGAARVGAHEQRLILRKRAVVAVDVVVVHEEEERGAAVFPQPGDRLVGDAGRRLLLVCPLLDVQVVVEPALETGARGEVQGVHDRRRHEACAGEEVGQRGDRRGEHALGRLQSVM